MFFGIDWNSIGIHFDRRVDTFACSSASPCEIEALPFATAPAVVRVIGFSRYEMNEERISNQRPDLVPVWQTLTDLRASGMPWDYCKKVLGQYPASYLRKVFPTAGYSTAVMVGLRDKARQFTHRSRRPGVSVQGGEAQVERVTDWDAGRLARNVAICRAFGGDREVFGGPKWQALTRLAATASNEHPLVVIVLPVSPFYQRNVGSPAGAVAFDALLETAALQQPGLHVIRADRLPELDDNSRFCDFVHINLEGRTLLTPHVEKFLTPLLPPP